MPQKQVTKAARTKKPNCQVDKFEWCAQKPTSADAHFYFQNPPTSKTAESQRGRDALNLVLLSSADFEMSLEFYVT
jgi:hypothetical protein